MNEAVTVQSQTQLAIRHWMTQYTSIVTHARNTIYVTPAKVGAQVTVQSNTGMTSIEPP